MKILLVQSPTGRREAPIYPLGLAYLAGQLEGHELQGLDLGMVEDFTDILRERIATFSPELVAISLRNIDDSSYPVTHSYIEPFAEIMEALRSWEGKVVVGGTGFSIYSEILMEKFPRIDYGIPGEGEAVFSQFIEHLESGTDIEGWDGGSLLPWKSTDLASISPPDYGILDVSDYPFLDAIGVQSRRGCAYGCSYCTYGFLSGKSFRSRPVDHVIFDIGELVRMGVGRFQFVDSVFNAPEEYFQELLDALIDADMEIKWSAWIDERVTPEQLACMKRAGAVKVDLSPDAITDRGLRALSKRSAAADLLPAVRAARNAGLQVGINFFNGNPEEGFIAFIRKLAFMLRVRISMGWRDTFVNIGTIRVYAHAPIAKQMQSDGLVGEECDFFEPVFFRKKGPSDWLYRTFQKLRRLRHGRG